MSELLDTVAQGIWNFLVVIINTFLALVFSPINASMQQLMVAILSTEQLTNFYSVLNNYIIPTCGFFINLVPPLTWNAILLFISFYVSLFSIVFVLHWVLKFLRIAKRLIPFV